MTFNPDVHHRRSIRLREYDYSSVGAYFITICAHGRECLFGDCVDGEMRVNDAGRMVVEWWLKLPERFPQVLLDECVIMPNHFHGIIIFTNVFDRRGDTLCSPAFDVCDTLCSPAFDVCDTLCSPVVGCSAAIDKIQNQGEHKVTPLQNQNQNQGDDKVHPNGTIEKSLGRVVQAFKSLTTVEYAKGVNDLN